MKVEVIYYKRGPLKSKLNGIVMSGRSDEEEYCYSPGYPDIIIGNLSIVRLRFQRLFVNKYSDQYISMSITSRNCESSKDLTIKMIVTCDKLNYSEEWISSEHGITWRKMGNIYPVTETGDVGLYIFEIDVIICVMDSPLVKLYNDKDFTDFNLSATEGSVAVHKACLACHSDILKTMLGGEWKETIECRLEPQGVTLQTLQHFKDYLYLGILPTHGLRQLLLLAMRYMINTLKAKCISRLARKVTPEDLFDLLEFARKNEIPDLTLAVMQLTPNKVVEDISQSLKQLEVGRNDRQGEGI